MPAGPGQFGKFTLLCAALGLGVAILLCRHSQKNAQLVARQNSTGSSEGRMFPQSMESARQVLDAKPKPDAVAQIIRWLDSGTDTVTGAEFKLAPDGNLAGAPTLRTFLLGELTKTDRAAAAVYAEKILSEKTSADEWALALRAYALGTTNAEAREYLQQKFQALVHDDEWRENPSVGFLEAFDVAVYAHLTALTAEFSAMVGDKANRATAHAAYLTMDRLAQAQPDEMFLQLQAHPEWMAGNEATRADLFARADMREAGQRAILENYLLNPLLPPVELQQFTGIFPNANFIISHNLLTGTSTPGAAELAARDRAALQTVNHWLADPRFESRRAALETIKQRLERFVQQAGNQEKSK